MNAASRFTYQDAVSKQTVSGLLLTKFQMTVGILILALLLAGIGVVYLTYLNRVLLSDLEYKEQENRMLTARHAQLVLERGVQLTEARVENMAKQKLSMTIPSQSRVVIVHR